MSDTDTAEPITVASTEVTNRQPRTQMWATRPQLTPRTPTRTRTTTRPTRSRGPTSRSCAARTPATGSVPATPTPYAQRLHTELVRATGRLADPTDLEFNEDHLDDPDALAAAVDDLLARKPHLASRRPTGEIGQGATPSAATVDLAALLRQRAR